MEDRIQMLQELLRKGVVTEEQYNNLLVSISEVEKLEKDKSVQSVFGRAARQYVDDALSGEQRMLSLEDYNVNLDSSLFIPKETLYRMMSRQVVAALDKGEIIDIPLDLDLSYNLPQGEETLTEEAYGKFIADTRNRLELLVNNADPNTLAKFFGSNRSQSYTNKINWKPNRYSNIFDTKKGKQEADRIGYQMANVFNKFVQHNIHVDSKGGMRDVYLTEQGVVNPKEVKENLVDEAYRVGYAEAQRRGAKSFEDLEDTIPSLSKKSKGKLNYDPSQVMKGAYGYVAEQNPDMMRNMVLNEGDSKSVGVFELSDYTKSENPAYINIQTAGGKTINMPIDKVEGLRQYVDRVDMLESLTGDRDRAIHQGGNLWWGGAAQ